MFQRTVFIFLSISINILQLKLKIRREGKLEVIFPNKKLQVVFANEKKRNIFYLSSISSVNQATLHLTTGDANEFCICLSPISFSPTQLGFITSDLIRNLVQTSNKLPSVYYSAKPNSSTNCQCHILIFALYE